MASPHYEWGELLYEQGRYEQAILAFQQALAQDAGNSYAKYLLAFSLYQLNRPTDALVLADDLLTEAPDNPYYFDLRAQCLFDLGRRKEAFSAADEAITLDPNEVTFHHSKSRLRLTLGQYKAALSSAETGLMLDPQHEGCLLIRAQCLVILNRHVQMADAVTDVLRVAPDDASSHMTAGIAMIMLGNHRQARQHFTNVLRLDPKLDLAEVGLADAIKSRSWLYRLYLRYTFWLGRLPRVLERMMFFPGLYVGIIFLAAYLHFRVDLFAVLFFVSLATLPLSWLVEPTFTLLFAYAPDSKHLLLEQPRRLYRCIPPLLLLAVGLIVFDVLTWPAYVGSWAGIGLMLFSLCYLLYGWAKAETPLGNRVGKIVAIAYCGCIGAVVVLQILTKLGMLGAIAGIMLFAVNVVGETYWLFFVVSREQYNAWRNRRAKS